MTDRVWDDRYWQLSQKATNPVETYQDIVRQKEAEKDAPSIDELPPEQQAWLRATS